jgi:multidrug efflux pump subunit AcrB
MKNGLQALLIVFILLTLFLDLKLAMWVAIGIPFSICATSIFFFGNDLTLNMVSTFGIIIGLGIVVDDSIVAGENIYTHRSLGKSYLNAAIDGIAEVAAPIFSSIITTIVAFLPLVFVSGMMGKIFYIIPVTLIVMLIASLTECFSILPCHLAHRDNLFFRMMRGYLYIFLWLLIPLRWASRYTGDLMDFIVRKIYAPSIVWTLRNRMIFMTGCLCTLAVTTAVVVSGTIPFVFFPKMDGNDILVTLTFPNGTPAEVTDRWTQHLEQTFWKVAKEYEQAGTPVAVRSARVVGTSLNARGVNLSGESGGGSSYQGSVQVELIGGDQRSVSSVEIADRWRKEAGPIPGADKVQFETQMFGPDESPIELILLAKSSETETLEKAVEECKTYLAGLEGTQDITDSDMPGKYEFRLKIKEKAMAMGLHPEDLASVIRATYYGSEVQRLQRGRHEVKVMVCYPREDRRSLGDFNEIRIRTATGEFPITELADIEVVRGYTTITRRNQLRSITVSSDVDENRGNAQKMISLLNTEFLPKLQQKYPGISVIWGGNEEEFAESRSSLILGFTMAMCGMFILLTIQFRSYLQPFIIMAIIPFGLIGAVAAHALFGHPLSFMSLFGLIALSGIIINDSIVMIDFINRRYRNGDPLQETLILVGQNRFRPIVLTSVTTIGGLMPMVLETSFQAQMMIPMALSLTGGVALALVLVLYFVPVLYSYYADYLEWNEINLDNIINNPELNLEPQTVLTNN